MTKRLLLALSSSLLLILLAPRWSLGFLAPVALVPLLLAVIAEPDFRKRLALGFAAGIPYWFFVCLWIEHVLQFHGGMDTWLAWVSFLLFSFLKAVHMAVFCGLAGLFQDRRGWWWPAFIAALWTGIERTHGTFGFAWLTLGNAGIDVPWLLGVPAITGVYGLSFLFALSAAAAAHTIATRKLNNLAWLAAYLLALAILPPAPSAPTQTALVVQPMMPQASEWTRELLDQKLKGLIQLSNSSDAPLLIWPEMPGPLYFDGDPAFHEIAVTLAQARQRYFLFGTVTRASDGAPLNSAVMLTPSGAEVGRYHKNNLVPFGEFVPQAFSWVNRITQEAGDFKPGTERTVFRANGGAAAGTFICYESAFPEFVRQFARDGAGYFVNISNDGYFGESKAREQHLSLVRMRAVESRRWIVRATNSGITAVIDPLGRVTQTLPEYQHTSAVVRYGVSSEITPYARYGDWFGWGCLATAVLASGLRGSRRFA